MRIWTLVQGFNSNDFELQIKDKMGLNKGVRIEEKLNLTQDLNSKEGLNIYKEWKFDKEDFDVLSELKNWPGSGMKFGSMDLIQMKGYSKSKQGLT
jgi:hypothetical protein